MTGMYDGSSSVWTALATSYSANPIQLTAHGMKFRSRSRSVDPPVDSDLLPRRPCPYSVGCAGSAAEATFGIVHTNGTSMVGISGFCAGRPSGP